MPAKLFIVHGSHPCDTVAKALEIKGMPYKTVELPPPSHAAIQPLIFRGRTVPGIKFEDGEKVLGSRKIVRAIEQRVPEPRLYTGPEVEEAEEWGDLVLQPIARHIVWPTFARYPRAMHAYQEGQKSPKLPLRVVLIMAPVIVRIERMLNDVTDDAVIQKDLQDLPGHLDKIDAWIAEGVLGGDQPNAADLQIATSLRLIHTIGDVRPLIAGRPAEELAFKWFDPLPGSTPTGVLPSEWIPAAPDRAAA